MIQKETLVILLILFFSSLLKTQDYKVMTYNIRYDNKKDLENNWENRKEKMVELINYHHPEIFGIQEGLNHQVAFLDNSLDNYKFVGVGRDDGLSGGEYSAIFYDTTVFKMIKASTFWLSDTPEHVSVGWDAALERICTFALLEDRKTLKKLWVFNTHFDHKGQLARVNSSKLIIEKIGQFNTSFLPVVLMGDFNATPVDLPIQIIKRNLEDALDISTRPLYGPSGTFNGFDITSVMDRRIDYIFALGFQVHSYAHIDDRRDDNKHVSDHLPVIVSIEMKNK